MHVAVRRGYRGLLNVEEQPHRTVFLSDFPLPPSEIRRVKRALRGVPTTPTFLVVQRDDALRRLLAHGVAFDREYVSLHSMISREENLGIPDKLFRACRRGDLAMFEVPLRNERFHSSFADDVLTVVLKADYGEQERIATRFFTLLAARVPYEVTIRTSGGIVTIADRRAWFDLAGKLRDREKRILPGGEVAYTGDRIDGSFVADGAILATPQAVPAASDAIRLGRCSVGLARNPLRIEIRCGRVVAASGGTAAAELKRLFALDARYRNVTEVGISFNRACRTFVHDRPFAANEGRPGVHLALGGDPDEAERGEGTPLVHADFMAANCAVSVNDHPFLRASS